MTIPVLNSGGGFNVDPHQFARMPTFQGTQWITDFRHWTPSDSTWILDNPSNQPVSYTNRGVQISTTSKPSDVAAVYLNPALWGTVPNGIAWCRFHLVAGATWYALAWRIHPSSEGLSTAAMNGNGPNGVSTNYTFADLEWNGNVSSYSGVAMPDYGPGATYEISVRWQNDLIVATMLLPNGVVVVNKWTVSTTVVDGSPGFVWGNNNTGTCVLEALAVRRL